MSSAIFTHIYIPFLNVKYNCCFFISKLPYKYNQAIITEIKALNIYLLMDLKCEKCQYTHIYIPFLMLNITVVFHIKTTLQI